MPHQKTSDLIRNGEYARAWERHCAFLDLTLPDFMSIQRRLLEEQFALATKSKLWTTLFPEFADKLQVDNFQHLAPLTSYATYETLLADQPDDLLARPVKAWARTSGRGGRAKWVPLTDQAYEHLGMSTIGTNVLASARQRGDVVIRPNDLVVHNLPAPPYLSGWSLVAESEQFEFRFLPSVTETAEMDFQERNARVFQRAMIEGMDILGSMTIVLVKMGEAFESGANRRQQKFSLSMLHPRLLLRYGRARYKARQEGRDHILPRDLWQPKAIIAGGADTALYRERIRHYWGTYPYEVYGCTEAGFLACQAWAGEDLFFIPSTAFYEFIPESAWARERLEGVRPGETYLMDELKVGERYEVVITNFYGGPFLRYRMHDLVEVVGLEDEKAGIRLPRFRFAGRSGDFIDLSGFAGLIDERQVSGALMHTGLAFSDWTMTKEISDGQTLLHLFIEPAAEETASDTEIRDRLNAQLKQANEAYADIERMLGYTPLRVTRLSPNTFNRYMRQQVDAGADLAHLKPTRIQPADDVIERLMSISKGLSSSES